jgi:hypothetical protein
MDNFEKEDLLQLINFYKNRAADLELQLLQAQLKINRLETAESIPATKITKTKSE